MKKIKKEQIKEIDEELLQVINKLKERKSNLFDYYLKVIPEFIEDSIHVWEVIYYIGKTRKPQDVLEIGTRNGGSLVVLLSSYKSGKTKVKSFDLWREGSEKKVRNNLKHMDLHPEIEFIKGRSTQTIPIFRRDNKDMKFDYILVDGGHDKDTAELDLYNTSVLLKKNGILVMDDLTDSYQLIDVWDKWANHTNLKTYKILEGNGIGIAVMP